MSETVGSVRTGTVSNREDLIHSGIQHAPRNEAVGHIPEQGGSHTVEVQADCQGGLCMF